MRGCPYFILAVNVCLVVARQVEETLFPDPLPIQGPFFFVHDPSLVQREDGKYFLFTTHDKAGIITATHLNGCVRLFFQEFHANTVLAHGQKSDRYSLAIPQFNCVRIQRFNPVSPFSPNK